MRDDADDVQTVHALAFQSPEGMAARFAEEGDDQTRAVDGDLLGIGGMKNRALKNSLQRRCFLGNLVPAFGQGFHSMLQVHFKFAADLFEVDLEQIEKRLDLFVVEQGEQNVFEGKVLVPSLAGRLPSGLE